MRRRRRERFQDESSDPLESVVNLFELAMVLAVALLTMIALRFNMSDMFTDKDFTVVKNPGKADMEIITKTGSRIEKYKASDKKGGEGQGNGKRVGTAYQLDNGEIIYVPE